MSQTLGEQLRQAREEKGISIAEVAEQTRISPHYIESIERDDYKPLPGGIFNKGFVKSFAKFVDIDEHQALADYSTMILSAQPVEEKETRSYRPEVLTDDRGGRSMVPTVIMAVIILALMTGGILFLLNYFQNRQATQSAIAPANSNASVPIQASADTAVAGGAPQMSELKVEFKAVGSPVSLSATSDSKFTNSIVAAGSTVSFEPKESLKLGYSRSLASAVQLTINGKAITPPAQPPSTKRNIEFEINKVNLAQIWQTGSIAGNPASETPAPNTNAAKGSAATATVRQTPAKGASAAANTASGNSNKPPIKTNPTPKPTNMAVPTATKPKP